MRLNIFPKLFLAMLLATVMVAVVMALFMNWSFRSGFADYHHGEELEQAQQLADALGMAYTRRGNWDFIRRNPREWGRLLGQIGERPPAGPPPAGLFPPPHLGSLPGMQPPGLPPPPAGNARRAPRPLGERLNLLDQDGSPVIGDPANLRIPAGNNARIRKLEILAAGERVGWVSVRQGNMATNKLAQTFMDQQRRNLYLIGLFAAGLSFLLAALLVRHFLRPVHSLTAGAQALTAGEFNTRIQVDTRDELGVLANNFNTLAEALQRNERLRQQWLADISHELRTPIAVLRSEIEAMLDGIREPNLERIHSLHVDVLSLGKLVDDLYQLSLADSLQLELPDAPVNLTEVLQDAAEAAETRLQEKGISLTARFDPDQPVWIKGDGSRLFQLFSNLLANSYRYTDTGGRVEVLVGGDASRVRVTVQDSAPGVPDEALPRLFERLFRVDKSRSRTLGGSGLGLSICQNIVQAHGGSIWAEHSSLGGLAVCMEFPLLPGIP